MNKNQDKNTNRILTKTASAFLLITIFLGLIITGCGTKETKLPTVSELAVDFSGCTGAGIAVGSGYDEFVQAYGDCLIQKVCDEGGFEPFEITTPDKDMPYETEDVVLMISGFYIDDKPVSTEEIKTALGTDIDNTDEALTDKAYLAEHTVLYRYLIFTIQNNVVTDIKGDYMNYNEDLF